MVEEREEPVVFALRDGIVFVRVALGAAQREAHPHLGRGVGPVFHGRNPKLLVVGAAFGVGHGIAMKPGGDDRARVLAIWGLGQQVACELFDRETVVSHVVVQRADHPVAPRPDVQPERVGAVTGGIGISCEVEPDARPTFTVRRRTQQPVNQPFVSVRSPVVQEPIRFLRRWRQPGQVER